MITSNKLEPPQTKASKIEVVKIPPIKHRTKPPKLIALSSSDKPKAVTKMPIAGKVLVPGMGIIIEIAMRAIATPIVTLPGNVVQI
ncbi:hypothetical protein SR1949_48290 [Sphaerospermopsis reniformis]|uniref:Uncharacterized protein n=1 Tax=Sphaerospermopsis reniformis TaxID=531300 RepID=A0A480A993_9CYAN|nr:hypothetical protein SR1949_48290 [Sphaerospermopsis reniformis]